MILRSCLLTIVFVTSWKMADQGRAAEESAIVRRDQTGGTVTVIVPTENGRLDLDDLRNGLARAGRFDGRALVGEIGEIEGGGLNLNDESSRLSVRALSAVTPDVKMRVIGHPVSGQPALKIRLERAEARRKIRRVKAMIRERFPDGREGYGLRIDGIADRQPPGRMLIVLVHGYGGGHHSMGGLHQALNEHGFGCATFSYPNDGPLAEAAELLAEELEDFHDEHPERKLAFVTHSMGGLVVRAVIEDPALTSRNVDRLIMVCPPNHGSPWTQLPGGLECWEYLRSEEKEPLRKAFTASVSDGLNEARHDLRSGSAFLRKLNARRRNPQVKYSIILGTAAPFTGGDLGQCREQVARALVESRGGRFVMPRVDGLFEGLRQVASGRGDGVVSLESGKLDGVQDVLLLPINHGAATGELSSPGQQRLLEAILDRL